MTELFGRSVTLQLGGNDLLNSYSDLRIAFSVEKTLKSTPNTANIEVYGLNRQSVAQYLASNTDLRVRLFAGYEGSPVLIFEGYPVKKEGLVFTAGPPDSVLKIKAKDGSRRFERARVNLALNTETTYEDILVEVAGSLGLPVDTIDAPPDIRLTSGTTLVGQAEDILDRLALASGADWSCQDGRFQFIQKSGVRRGIGPLFSAAQRNVVGSPRRKDKGIELTTFLQGALVPGGTFKYQADQSNLAGDYKITKVKYAGDSHSGSQFYATIEGSSYTSVEEQARLSAAKSSELEAKISEVVVDVAQFLVDNLTPTDDFR